MKKLVFLALLTLGTIFFTFSCRKEARFESLNIDHVEAREINSSQYLNFVESSISNDFVEYRDSESGCCYSNFEGFQANNDARFKYSLPYPSNPRRSKLTVTRLDTQASVVIVSNFTPFAKHCTYRLVDINCNDIVNSHFNGCIAPYQFKFEIQYQNTSTGTWTTCNSSNGNPNSTNKILGAAYCE